MSNSTILSPFFQAAEVALFIDLPFSILVGATPAGVALQTGAALTGYAIRKYCNHYVDESFDKSTFTGMFSQSALCGGLGGAMKYGLSGGFTPARVIMGAVNNMLYELSNHESKYNVFENEYSFLHNAVSIEGSETFVKAGLAYFEVAGSVPKKVDTSAPTSEKSFFGELSGNLVGGIIIEFLAANVLVPLHEPYTEFTNYLGEQIISYFNTESNSTIATEL